jgi:uncharacterized protein involved in exopolysaccharide biosynthesis
MKWYLVTFRAHRILLLAPIVLTAVLAVWTVAGTPKAYEATASLWIDNPPPATSSLIDADPTIRPPAEQHQLILDQLLKTREFRVGVARKSPLARYLEGNPSTGWSPMAMLAGLSKPASMDSRIVSALTPKQVTSTVAGPQVLQLSYHGPTPAVAAKTLETLIEEFRGNLTDFGRARGQSTVEYYQERVNAASRAVEDARRRAAEYRAAHPGVTEEDPYLRALLRADRTARRDLSAATASLNEVGSDVKRPGVGVASEIRVIDAPKPPTGPVSGMKMLVMALIGGLFAGGLVSLLGVIALTPSRSSDWDAAAGQPQPALAQELGMWDWEPVRETNGHGAHDRVPHIDTGQASSDVYELNKADVADDDEQPQARGRGEAL